MKQITYHGWANCYHLSNDHIELIFTADVGPRVLHFSFINDENVFAQSAEDLGQTGGDRWRVYGGHRFWHAPEVAGRTDTPDNDPVKVEDHGRFLRLVQPVEPATGIQKEIDIQLHPNQPQVALIHRLRNRNRWSVELAPWALSVMAPGGVGILPIPQRGTHPEHLLPTNTLSMWAYTDLADPRWTWGREFILLRQDATAAQPQKLGIMNQQGWAAYVRNGRLFVKAFAPHDITQRYPDFNASAELFTNSDMLEVESLGPLVNLPPGAEVTHQETWHLFADVPTPESDADVKANVLPHVQALQNA